MDVQLHCMIKKASFEEDKMRELLLFNGLELNLYMEWTDVFFH